MLAVICEYTELCFISTIVYFRDILARLPLSVWMFRSYEALVRSTKIICLHPPLVLSPPAHIQGPFGVVYALLISGADWHYTGSHVPWESSLHIPHCVLNTVTTLAAMLQAQYGYEQLHLNAGKENFPRPWADSELTMIVPTVKMGPGCL
jgi:hypothetical protein